MVSQHTCQQLATWVGGAYLVGSGSYWCLVKKFGAVAAEVEELVTSFEGCYRSLGQVEADGVAVALDY